MLISEAFKAFGATLNNVQWSVSAFNDQDELVVSLWDGDNFEIEFKQSN